MKVMMGNLENLPMTTLATIIIMNIHNKCLGKLIEFWSTNISIYYLLNITRKWFIYPDIYVNSPVVTLIPKNDYVRTNITQGCGLKNKLKTKYWGQSWPISMEQPEEKCKNQKLCGINVSIRVKVNIQGLKILREENKCNRVLLLIHDLYYYCLNINIYINENVLIYVNTPIHLVIFTSTVLFR